MTEMFVCGVYDRIQFQLCNITLDNFMAAVSSMQNESWRWPTVVERCNRPDGVCYPFSNPHESPDDGIEPFTDDKKSSPIPSGLVELPISMNLKAASGANLFAGKIISNDTLHYAGSPNISSSVSGAMP